MSYSQIMLLLLFFPRTEQRLTKVEIPLETYISFYVSTWYAARERPPPVSLNGGIFNVHWSFWFTYAAGCAIWSQPVPSVSCALIQTANILLLLIEWSSGKAPAYAFAQTEVRLLSVIEVKISVIRALSLALLFFPTTISSDDVCRQMPVKTERAQPIKRVMLISTMP